MKWMDTPNRTVTVDGVPFAYRELGTGDGVPVVFLHHLMAGYKYPRLVEFVTGLPMTSTGKILKRQLH